MSNGCRARNALLVGLSLIAFTAGQAQAETTPAPATPATAPQTDGNVSPQAQSPAQRTAKGASDSTGIEDIVVTAQRRESTIQDTAAAISAIGGIEIRERGKLQVVDVLQSVPNVQVLGATRGFQVAIRGLGYDLAPGQGEGAVSYNDDGVYNNRQEAGRTGFYDLNRVEVLRGPQGTLYGRNATAGVVNIVSNDPEFDHTDGYAKVGFGNYNLRQAEAAVNLPVSSTFAMRAAIAYVDRDGFLSSGQGDLVASSARLKALWKPTDAVSLLVGGLFTKTGGKGPGVVNGFVTPPADPNQVINTALQTDAYDHTDYYKLYAKLDVDLGFGVLTALPAHQRQTNSAYYSLDGGSFTQGSDPLYQNQDSAELRLASPSPSPIKWLGGFYFYQSTSYNYSISPTSTLPNKQLNSSYNYLRSYAFFGEVSVPLGHIFTVTGGLRTTHDDKRVTSTRTNPAGVVTTPAFAQTFSRVDYKANISAQITPDSLLYAQVATGYRPGGFTFVSAFAAEHLTAYEIGSKNSFFNRRFQLNVTAFKYDYPDYQVSNSTLIGTQLQISVVNTPVSLKGIEVESQLKVTANDRLNASLAYTPSKYNNLILVSPSGAQTPEIGFPVAHTPEMTLNGGYEHIFTVFDGGQLSVRGDVHYQSGNFTKPTENATTFQPHYTTGNLAATFTPASNRWNITAFVNNVSDKVIKLGAPTPFISLAPPRTYGVNLTVRFGSGK